MWNASFSSNCSCLLNRLIRARFYKREAEGAGGHLVWLMGGCNKSKQCNKLVYSTARCGVIHEHYRNTRLYWETLFESRQVFIY